MHRRPDQRLRCLAADLVSITAALGGRAPSETGRGFSLGCGAIIAGYDPPGAITGIDAAICVIEVVEERARNCQVAIRSPVNVGGGAALYSLDDSPGRSFQ